MRTSLLLAACIALFGCDPEATNDPAPVPPTSQSSSPKAGGIAPMTSGAAGGLTPVTGTEDVGGGSGGGVQQSAIGAAQRAAAKSSSPVGTRGPAGPPGTDDGN